MHRIHTHTAWSLCFNSSQVITLHDTKTLADAQNPPTKHTDRRVGLTPAYVLRGCVIPIDTRQYGTVLPCCLTPALLAELPGCLTPALLAELPGCASSDSHVAYRCKLHDTKTLADAQNPHSHSVVVVPQFASNVHVGRRCAPPHACFTLPVVRSIHKASVDGLTHIHNDHTRRINEGVSQSINEGMQPNSNPGPHLVGSRVTVAQTAGNAPCPSLIVEPFSPVYWHPCVFSERVYTQ